MSFGYVGTGRAGRVLSVLRAVPLAALLLAPGACSSSSPAPATAVVDAGVAEELDLDEGTFTVPAGQEVVYCVRIPVPAAFQGRDLALTSWTSDITSPAHHYFLFYDSTTPATGTQPVPCMGTSALVPASMAGLNLFSMGELVLVAGTGQDSFSGNPDYGMVLPSNGSFVTNHHVINATAQDVTVTAHFKLMVKNATDVPYPTRALSCQTTDINLPPGQETDVTATCLAPYDLDIVTMSSHAHQDLTSFEQRFYDGTTTQPDVLYTSTQWDTPVVTQLTTPLSLKAGQGITFTCHYRNATSSAIVFGLTATTEMCAAMNQFAYPVGKTHVVPPMLGSTILSNSTIGKANNTSGSAVPALLNWITDRGRERFFIFARARGSRLERAGAGMGGAMAPATMSKLAPLFLVLTCAASCSTGPYVYRPAENATARVSDRPAAYYAVPAQGRSPRGRARRGARSRQGRYGRGPRARGRVMHLRMVVDNNDDTAAWQVDTREQLGSLGGYGESRPAFAAGPAGGPPVETIPPGATATIDLYYPLPTNMQKASEIPRFDILWRVETPAGPTTMRTSFDRVQLEPPPGYYAYSYPGWYGFYDPLWPNYAFLGSPAVVPIDQERPLPVERMR